MSTGRQAKLYAGSDDTGTLLGAVDVQVQAVGAPVQVRNTKDDQGFARIVGMEARQVRITAEGPATGVVHALLQARHNSGSVDSYYLEFGEGDSHAGDFVVEGLEAIARGDDRRRYRVTLLSSGVVAYTAP